MTTAGRPRSNLQPLAGLQTRSDQVDALVRAAWREARPAGTLLSVGGYGRRELFPYSDIDLILLVEETPQDRAARDAISHFQRLLWDASLHLGHSVRTARECFEVQEGNFELTVSLLDRRYLCGPEALYHEMAAGFAALLRSSHAQLARRLVGMTQGRHARFGNSIFHLEPNVKDHPGGIRDIHVIRWLGALTGNEAPLPEEARDFLYAVRVQLHEWAHRDQNLLSFEAQDALWPDPAAGMRLWYRRARAVEASLMRDIDAVERSQRTLLSQFRDWQSRLSNDDFTVSRERVLLRQPQNLKSDPGLALRLFTFVARHQLRLAGETEERLREAGPVLASLPRPGWHELRALLRLPRAAAGLRAMQATGFLRILFPEWERIDCQVTRDFYHQYTVDEHTLLTILNLEDLTSSTDPVRMRFTGLSTEASAPDLIKLAMLLHDIGKGDGAGEHVAASGRIARTVLERLGVPEDQQKTVLFLIENHLLLSVAISSRDLDDPATAAALAAQIGTVEQLKMLTLVTFADISAVNPTAFSPWRSEQLWHAYLATHGELTRELETDRIPGNGGSSELTRFLKGFPTRYLRTRSEREIRRDFGLLHLYETPGRGIAIEKQEAGWKTTVLAPDRPFLFASIAGALSSFGMNIVKAEAFTNDDRLALNSWVFTDPHRTLELNPGEEERLTDRLEAAVLGKLNLTEALRARRGKKRVASAQIEPRVTLNGEASARATLIEIVAEDRPALLYDLASILSRAGMSIDVVLIDTEANRALDVFYVTSGGGKLPAEVHAPLREELLRVCREQG